MLFEKKKKKELCVMSERQPPAENKMGTMPVNRLLLSMAIPMMISMLVQALYNVVDSYFVGWTATLWPRSARTR